MSFHQPSVWFLALLALLPLLWWRSRSPRRRAAVRFSSLDPVLRAGDTWAVGLRWVVPAMRLLAIAMLIVAIARPQKGDEQTRINTDGIAIQLVVDRSGSMRAMDFTIGGKQTDRLTVVKKVVREFVEGGDGLPGRPNDLIGAIVFASFADSICPLTTDHAHLLDAIQQTRMASEREESGTAIGDGLALGVERLKSLEQRVGIDTGMTIKSKIMILLTDGENNAGDIDPIEAANMAAAFDIKVYTIGAGTDAGMAAVPGRDIFGQQMMVPVSIDEGTLRKIADLTGGKYFRATDSESLRNIYEQIDQLERTEMQEQRFVTYKQAAVQRIAIGPLSFPPLLLVVLSLLAFETLLAATRFRTLP
jgi:Ca-activated chloride channel homolog